MYRGKSVFAIIQARMGSNRLPGKVLMNLAGKTVLDHIIDRLNRSMFIDKIIVATSTKEEDNKIVAWGKSKGVTIFRGSEQNVLKRYYDCSQKYPSDIFCRITADCPLISYRLVDNCIKLLIDNNRDYVSMKNNEIPRGLHGSIFTKEVLKDIYNKAEKDYQKEHVTYYIYEDNGDVFDIEYLAPPEWLRREYRLTLDTELDYKLLDNIFNHFTFKDSYIKVKEVINYLDNDPSVAFINSKVKQKKVKSK